jgi:hypothetical protein
MGTRGCVAVGTLEKWAGLYNHWDSYPSGLGVEVWAELQKNPELPDTLLLFDDWRSYLSGGICEYCGKRRGQSHSILMNEATQTKHGDPDALYHSHKEGKASDHHMHQDDADPLFIEWVYIIDKPAGLLHVLAHVSNPDFVKGSVSQNVTVDKEGWTNYGHCAFKHVHVGSYELNSPEPDWGEVDLDALRTKASIDAEYEDYLQEALTEKEK